MSGKARFLEVYEREFPTTVRVLEAYPTDKEDYRPHEKARTAKELAWVFARGESALAGAVHGQIDFEVLMSPAPATLGDVIATYRDVHRTNVELLQATSDAELEKTVRFLTGPGEMGDWKRSEFLWFILHDSIHHRGQFSVYVRMVGGRVPSIYGPSADEAWQ